MADPVTATLLAVSIGTTVAGGAVAASGAAAAGKASSDMYKYQAGVAQMNKTVADQNRDYAFASGEVEAQQQGMKTRFQIGQTRATQGAGGLDVNTGSNAQIQDSESAIGVQNQNVTRSNAAKKAYGYEVDASNATASAQVYNMSAANAITAANYKVAGSIIGTASSVAGKWTQASAAFGTPGGTGPGGSWDAPSETAIY